MLSRYCWKLLKEEIQAVPGFEIIDEVAQGDASPHEDRFTSQNIGVTVNYEPFSSHVIRIQVGSFPAIEASMKLLDSRTASLPDDTEALISTIESPLS